MTDELADGPIEPTEDTPAKDLPAAEPEPPADDAAAEAGEP